MLQDHPLFQSLDWSRIEAGQYAVVDPVNTGSILYVSYQDYLILVRVALSNNITLKILAAPGETNPNATEADDSSASHSPNDQKSPPRKTDLKKLEEELLEWYNSRYPHLRPRTSMRRRVAAAKQLLRSALTEFSVMGDSGSLMVKLSDGNIRKWLTMWHDRLHWLSRATVPGNITNLEVSSFAENLRRLLKHNGVNSLIQRFKISLFVVNAYIGGRKLLSTQDLGMRIRLRSGLPAFLPLRVRNGIRYGNLHYVRIWTSVLNSYKGIEGTHEIPDLSASSITQAAPEIQTEHLYKFGIFTRLLWRQIKRLYRPRPLSIHVSAPFFTTKAGPNSPVSLLGAGLDAYLWYSLDRVLKYRPDLPAESKENLAFYEHQAIHAFMREELGVDQNLIRIWLEATGQKALERMIRMTSKMFALQFNLLMCIRKPWFEFLGKVKDSPHLYKSMKRYMIAKATASVPKGHKKKSPPKLILGPKGRALLKDRKSFWDSIMGMNNPMLRFRTPTLSRLHLLYEAAGKVRVIAIVDYWTNFVLKPIHDWMFQILSELPQDATFDQEGRVEEFASRGYTEVYSYDLKSATDLIPLRLYRFVFGPILTRNILEPWLRLLVDRSFLVPKDVLDAHPHCPLRVRYGTGQPMGALTSWASMALVHHALVLFSAYSSGVVTKWEILSFREYLVLGDDVVIANKTVAEAYTRICKEFSIPIGLAKSHISNVGMFNFANQTFKFETNVSPLSMKEELNAKGLLSRLAFVMRMARRGWRDLESRSWLSQIMKALTNPTIWRKTLAPLAEVQETVPFLHWVIASALLPGTSRFGYTGLSVDPRLLLSTFVRKDRVWTTRLRDMVELSLTASQQSLLSLFTARWVDNIYQQFLDNRIRLKEFDSWKTRVISVDLEWLFTRIFIEGRGASQERWAEKYRLPLKEIQVATKLPAVNTVALLEYATGLKIDKLFALLQEAERELPLIPDFTEKTLSSLIPTEGGELPTRELELRRAELQAMLRVASLVVMLDAIPNSDKPGQMSGPTTLSPTTLEHSLRLASKKGRQ